MQDELLAKLRKSALVNKAGLTYKQFRKSLTPKWGIVWSHIAMGWMALVVSNLLIILLSGRHLAMDLLLVGGGSILIGFIIAYLQLFLHEAAHYNLHPQRKINDLLCNLFVGGIAGQDVKNYRPIHWDHHRYLGTTLDTEITYFDPLNIKFLVEALLGIRVLKVIFTRREKLRNKKSEVRSQAKSKPYTLIGGFIFNLGYLFLLLYFHQWGLMLAWLGGILVFFPYFGALRQLLEHRNAYADPALDYAKVAHGAIHRLFGDSLIASTLGGAGFNRHLLHHWESEVSYTRLRELEHYLMGTECAAYLQERQTTYRETFWLLFHPVWR
ncbi:MAG: fatty acid desaturase [Gammaproteobacteria bacterium]|nr:fatty acid desaturase [Gammaproteobacteria bacterium]